MVHPGHSSPGFRPWPNIPTLAKAAAMTVCGILSSSGFFSGFRSGFLSDLRSGRLSVPVPA